MEDLWWRRGGEVKEWRADEVKQCGEGRTPLATERWFGLARLGGSYLAEVMQARALWHGHGGPPRCQLGGVVGGLRDLPKRLERAAVCFWDERVDSTMGRVFASSLHAWTHAVPGFQEPELYKRTRQDEWGNIPPFASAFGPCSPGLWMNGW